MQDSTERSGRQNADRGYLTLSQVARRLNIGRTKAYELVVVQKKIKAKRFGERAIRVHEDDLQDYIDTCDL